MATTTDGEGGRNVAARGHAALNELGTRTFIYELHDALDADLCAEIVRRFELKADQQYAGRIGEQAVADPSVKRSTDLRISGRPDWEDVDGQLHRSLQQALSLVAGLHPFFSHNAFKDIGYNVQRTRAGEYYHWHIDSGPGSFSQRQLVAIWYLNDVAGPGGETEFPLQNVRVSPQRGKLVLFPPFWTHLHRGATLHRGTKYIATTWVCFAG